jgi:hypothetical protein
MLYVLSFYRRRIYHFQHQDVTLYRCYTVLFVLFMFNWYLNYIYTCINFLPNIYKTRIKVYPYVRVFIKGPGKQKPNFVKNCFTDDQIYSFLFITTWFSYSKSLDCNTNYLGLFINSFTSGTFLQKI